MANLDEDEKDIEIPSEDDENVGDGAPKKKKEKKRKTKEERIAERKTIFWTLLVVLVVTLIFWLLPVIKGTNKSGIFEDSQKNAGEKETSPDTKTDHKNYVEITL